MKKLYALFFFVFAIGLCLALSACGEEPEGGTLKICVDGSAFDEVGTMAAAFMEAHPEIQIEVDELPQVRLELDENNLPILDTDSLAERESVLQQHRTALMAGSGDTDLYLLTGGISQFYPMNGGALVQDPYDLMENGVLADLSALLNRLDRSAYLNGVFESGQAEGVQYLIPLRVALSGFVTNLSKDPVLPADRDAFMEALQQIYLEDLFAANVGCVFSFASLSYPVVNKARETIFLYDENYTRALDLAKSFRSLYSESITERISLEGRTLLTAGSNPLLTASSIANRPDAPEQLGYQTIPDENNGVTVEITAYAFVPAKGDSNTAMVFLEWLLSKKAQDGSFPIFSGLGGGYPVLKGCATDILANTPAYSALAERGGETFVESLSECEAKVTTAKHSTQYDYELLNLLNSWQSGDIPDLHAALAEMYEKWALYLDE